MRVLLAIKSLFDYLFKMGEEYSQSKISAFLIAALTVSQAFGWTHWTPEQVTAVTALLGVVLVNGLRKAIHESGPTQ